MRLACMGEPQEKEREALAPGTQQDIRIETREPLSVEPGASSYLEGKRSPEFDLVDILRLELAKDRPRAVETIFRKEWHMQHEVHDVCRIHLQGKIRISFPADTCDENGLPHFFGTKEISRCLNDVRVRPLA